MNEIIKEFARRLEEIYQNRTAGDYTFEGLLYEFSIKAQPELARTYVPGEDIR